MMFALGVVLFALGLLASIAWHECGHMWAAQRTGMKVRRYFVGFGPTLWSTRRGETEYGVKAIPLGGFCDIAGMTTHDELAPEDESRAMYKQKAWKRIVVLAAGPAQNLILGFALIVIMALAWGLPNLAESAPAKVGAVSCVSDTVTNGESAPCTGAGPAEQAGLLPGDTVVAANGKSISDYSELSTILRSATAPVALTVDRGGQSLDLTVTPQTVTAVKTDDKGAVTATQDVSMVGITYDLPPAFTHPSAAGAVPAAFVFTGELVAKTWDSLLSLPSKIGALWTSVTGGERATDTPVSVYGASVIGGDAADNGYWWFFVFLLASINFFLALFNLVPLLPLDGGHMAIVGYEKVRNTLRRSRGLGVGAPVDYLKLMPITYVVLVIMGGYMALTLTADIVNPIKAF
ncbi:M50 family metallopeptidase [Williamsia sp. 1135]|uniref:M50 family metallopeptidase n=1 Tax=Williamsia sp. 1135 TaxID=1889262 RepID=UPI000A0F6356|nr:M50 family metallopeptidase [Williamsia sp. 1135]ORM23892.1 zinc metalloprotease [Williamsia sp. 1135]